ncbi:hypothetical protein ACIOEX_29300 [Streptomyces sp. NPDC087850]|uniref:hypothetical protein n=1 Tax=Streptomyces sp. NPDC087850 TaxID=3365809 RepID=UPI0038266CE0
MTQIDWEYLSGIADKVAYSIAETWRVVEKDDVKQEILLHAYECRPTLEDNYTDAFLWAFCRKAGTQYASAQRDARDVEDGHYYYTPREARVALATFLYTDEEISARIGAQDDLIGCRITDNIVSARIDAQKAFERLPKKTRQLLTQRFVMGMPISSDTERRASNRAVDYLARQMNRDYRKASV